MNDKLTIVADAHIAWVEAAFAQLPGFDIELRMVESGDIKRPLLADADILLTRSATKVNGDLLAGTNVRFAATATIGDDHYDKAWLQAHGIAFASAAGSSTGSVLEYMLAALLELHSSGRIHLPDCTVGIIGAGRIGGSLGRILESLGITVLYNDPPRARREGSQGFCELSKLLHEADILTLHTPLHRSAPDSTLHLIDAEQLAAFRGRGIINAARGAVVNNQALLSWLDADTSHFAVLDCWEHEPAISLPLLAHAGMAIPTPHIAGHSLDGKTANTLYAYRALCSFLNIEPVWDMREHLPPQPPYRGFVPTGDDWADLHALTHLLYPLHRDIGMMRSLTRLTADDAAQQFREYRRHYPERRAWDATPFVVPEAGESLARKAASIGIRMV